METSFIKKLSLAIEGVSNLEHLAVTNNEGKDIVNRLRALRIQLEKARTTALPIVDAFLGFTKVVSMQLLQDATNSSSPTTKFLAAQSSLDSPIGLEGNDCESENGTGNADRREEMVHGSPNKYSLSGAREDETSSSSGGAPIKVGNDLAKDSSDSDDNDDVLDQGKLTRHSTKHTEVPETSSADLRSSSVIGFRALPRSIDKSSLCDSTSASSSMVRQDNLSSNASSSRAQLNKASSSAPLLRAEQDKSSSSAAQSVNHGNQKRMRVSPFGSDSLPDDFVFRKPSRFPSFIYQETQMRHESEELDDPKSSSASSNVVYLIDTEVVHHAKAKEATSERSPPALPPFKSVLKGEASNNSKLPHSGLVQNAVAPRSGFSTLEQQSDSEAERNRNEAIMRRVIKEYSDLNAKSGRNVPMNAERLRRMIVGVSRRETTLSDKQLMSMYSYLIS